MARSRKVLLAFSTGSNVIRVAEVQQLMYDDNL